MSAPIPPDQLAAADQELAATDTALDVLIRIWRDQAVDDDRIRRVAEFIGGVTPYANATGRLALLAVAVERLAAR